MSTTIVLVHGAHAGGWWWGDVRTLLRAAGFTVLAPTLTGLGERSHLAGPGVDLEMHVEDIASTLAFEDLSGVVLVGCSYGGMVITGVADRTPARIASLVYLDALVPRDGEATIDLVGADRRASILARAAAGESSIPLGPDADARLAPQPLATFVQPLVLRGDGAQVPRTFVRCTSPPHPANALSAERILAEPGWDRHELEAGHSAAREKPHEVAALLARIAGGP